MNEGYSKKAYVAHEGLLKHVTDQAVIAEKGAKAFKEEIEELESEGSESTGWRSVAESTGWRIRESTEPEARFGGFSKEEHIEEMKGFLKEAELTLAVAPRNIERLRARLDEMVKQGNEEALALHVEYGRLMTQAEEALRALNDFEVEKLGMTKKLP